jgi:ribonuclease P protein component
MPPSPFPKTVRLRTKHDFRRTMDGGRKTVCPRMVLIGRERADDELAAGLRLGLVVSRKVGNSVERNRVKRHLRESFRHLRAELEQAGTQPSLDLVVIARPGAADCDSREMSQALQACYRRFQRPRST